MKANQISTVVCFGFELKQNFWTLTFHIYSNTVLFIFIFFYVVQFFQILTGKIFLRTFYSNVFVIT